MFSPMIWQDLHPIVSAVPASSQGQLTSAPAATLATLRAPSRGDLLPGSTASTSSSQMAPNVQNINE